MGTSKFYLYTLGLTMEALMKLSNFVKRELELTELHRTTWRTAMKRLNGGEITVDDVDKIMDGPAELSQQFKIECGGESEYYELYDAAIETGLLPE